MATVEEHISEIDDVGYTVVTGAVEADLVDDLFDDLLRLERELSATPAGNSFPLRRRPWTSMRAAISRPDSGALRNAVTWPQWSARTGSGTSWSTGCPSTSLGSYPNTRAALRLNWTIVWLPSIEMIASAE